MAARDIFGNIVTGPPKPEPVDPRSFQDATGSTATTTDRRFGFVPEDVATAAFRKLFTNFASGQFQDVGGDFSDSFKGITQFGAEARGAAKPFLSGEFLSDPANQRFAEAAIAPLQRQLQETILPEVLSQANRGGSLAGSRTDDLVARALRDFTLASGEASTTALLRAADARIGGFNAGVEAGARNSNSTSTALQALTQLGLGARALQRQPVEIGGGATLSSSQSQVLTPSGLDQAQQQGQLALIPGQIQGQQNALQQQALLNSLILSLTSGLQANPDILFA